MSETRKIAGTRCRLNDEGKGRYMRNKEREGTILRSTLDKQSYVILWDGRMSGETVGVDLIQKLYKRNENMKPENIKDVLQWYEDEGNYLGDNGELSTAWKDKMGEKAKAALIKLNSESSPDLSALTGEPLESNTGYTRADVPDQSIEEAAKDYADRFYPIKGYLHYESDYDYRTACAKHEQVQEHFRAGANSTRQQGDVNINPQVEKILQYVDKVIENYKRQIGEAYVEPYFFSELKRLIKQLSPLPIQPGIVEQLRNLNPRKDAVLHQPSLVSAGWNECCDTLAKIIEEEKPGEERRLQRQEDNNEHLGKCLQMLKYLYMNEYCGEHGNEVRDLIMPRPQPKDEREKGKEEK
jgi:hypothetical protein